MERRHASDGDKHSDLYILTWPGPVLEYDPADTKMIDEEKRLERLLSQNRLLSESDKGEALLKCAPAVFVWPGTGTTLAELLEDPQMGLIIGTTSPADRMYGYEEGELLGQPVEILMPERFRAGHRLHFARFVLNPVRRMMGQRDMALFGLRRDAAGAFVEFQIEIALEQKLVNRQKTIVALPQYARQN